MTSGYYDVTVVIRVGGCANQDDAEGTVNAQLQRGDGELDDGTFIGSWVFPVPAVEAPEAEALDGPNASDYKHNPASV